MDGCSDGCDGIGQGGMPWIKEYMIRDRYMLPVSSLEDIYTVPQASHAQSDIEE